MGVTFFNVSVEIMEDDPVKAYRVLEDIMQSPYVGEWESETFQVGAGDIKDTLELFE